MSISTIFVYYPDGSACSQTKVALGFNSGITKPNFTNNRGEVSIEYSSSGNATVYISEKNCGSFRAPGRTSVTYK